MRRRRVVRLFKQGVKDWSGHRFSSGAWSVRARGATRGPLDVLDVRSSTEIRALLRDQETSREDAARLPNTAALLSHPERSTRRARTAVVTEEQKLSAADAGRPSRGEHT